jgi:hypothetical protein
MNTFPVFTFWPDADNYVEELPGEAVQIAAVETGYPLVAENYTVSLPLWKQVLSHLTAAEKVVLVDFYKANKGNAFWWWNYDAQRFYQVIFAAPVAPRLAGVRGVWRAEVQLRQADMADYAVRPPIRHFRMDDNAASTVVYDSSDSAADGVASVNTSVLRAGGKIGMSFNFDGSSQYVRLPYTSALYPDQFSIALWVYADGSNQGVLFAAYGGDNRGYILWTTAFSVFHGTGSISGSMPSLTGGWKHIVATFDGDSLKVHLDGVLYSSAAFDQDFVTAERAPCLGKASWYDGMYFDGRIDDFRFYDVALTAAEIAAIYAEGSGNITSPIRHFKCNDNAASAVVTDSSVNAVNGAMAGGNTSAFSAAGKVSSCFNLAGTGRIDCGNDAALWPSRFSIALWATKSAPGERCLASGYCAWAGWLLLQGRFSIYAGASAGVDVSLSVPADGSWAHIVCTYDGGTARVYINGVVHASVAYTGGMTVPTGIDVWVGRLAHADDLYWDGKIDDVRLYDCALTAAEIAAIYNNGSGSEDV